MREQVRHSGYEAYERGMESAIILQARLSRRWGLVRIVKITVVSGSELHIHKVQLTEAVTSGSKICIHASPPSITWGKRSARLCTFLSRRVRACRAKNTLFCYDTGNEKADDREVVATYFDSDLSHLRT